MEGKEVMIAFIMVNSFSPYKAILRRPWIHAMGAILSILHVKIKFPIELAVAVVKGSQQAAKQCLVAAINGKNEQAKQKESVVETPS